MNIDSDAAHPGLNTSWTEHQLDLHGAEQQLGEKGCSVARGLLLDGSTILMVDGTRVSTLHGCDLEYLAQDGIARGDFVHFSRMPGSGHAHEIRKVTPTPGEMAAVSYRMSGQPDPHWPPDQRKLSKRALRALMTLGYLPKRSDEEVEQRIDEMLQESPFDEYFAFRALVRAHGARRFIMLDHHIDPRIVEDINRALEDEPSASGSSARSGTGCRSSSFISTMARRNRCRSTRRWICSSTSTKASQTQARAAPASCPAKRASRCCSRPRWKRCSCVSPRSRSSRADAAHEKPLGPPFRTLPLSLRRRTPRHRPSAPHPPAGPSTLRRRTPQHRPSVHAPTAVLSYPPATNASAPSVSSTPAGSPFVPSGDERLDTVRQCTPRRRSFPPLR